MPALQAAASHTTSDGQPCSSHGTGTHMRRSSLPRRPDAPLHKAPCSELLDRAHVAQPRESSGEMSAPSLTPGPERHQHQHPPCQHRPRFGPRIPSISHDADAIFHAGISTGHAARPASAAVPGRHSWPRSTTPLPPWPGHAASTASHAGAIRKTAALRHLPCELKTMLHLTTRTPPRPAAPEQPHCAARLTSIPRAREARRGAPLSPAAFGGRAPATARESEGGEGSRG